MNFQNERFDADEQNALLRYNQLFPLKRFWQNMIIIFTHHFGDPDGDSKEDMKENRDESNGKIFENLMEKVKEVSDVINYRDLNIKYFNSYSPVKNDKQKKKNLKVKEELEIELDELSKTDPLFSQIEVIHSKNQIMIDEKSGKKYMVELEIIGFFDLNGKKPLYEKKIIISKTEINKKKKEDLPPPEISVQVINAKKDANDHLHIVTEKGNKNNSNYLKGITVGAVGGIIVGGFIVGLAALAGIPAIGVFLGITATGAFIGSFFN